MSANVLPISLEAVSRQVLDRDDFRPLAHLHVRRPMPNEEVESSIPQIATLPTTPPLLDLAGRRYSTASFLLDVFAGAGGGHIALWTLPSKVTHWYSSDDFDGIAADAVLAAETENVYFGAGLQPRPMGANSRGQQDTVCGIPGFWLDVDI
jgi:hypothetical protein